ncbi:adhesion G-protein coupled receptor V1-like [Actinia tenebrosa]|uniref:Adhesion G-protein coupled receptor V1-like n=1 Tax=Actinia tenebrosa TaxID=6105 RepID=A0A6P8IBM1_ACTTE|nr:adhesion G-protein coupled receptor V1-like [Actinia tenebrosa]
MGIETGENGLLGNYTTAYLTVLSNDDPYGKLLFPSQSRDVKIPEDFEPGFKNTTIKNLTVMREQGDWGDIQVVWEIVTSEASIKTHYTYDLMFLGDVRSGVTMNPSKKRDRTNTNVYCFDASKSGSYATVSSLNGLSTKEITISSWLQPAKSTFGYLLSYAVGGDIVYALAVNTTASTSSLFFEFDDSNVTVALGVDFADNAWHMVVITLNFGTGVAKFYLAGSQKLTWNFAGRSVDTSGTFTVGALQPDQQKYTGCIQDIRIQAAVLEGSTVEEMPKAINDFKQLNGYLDFPAGVRHRNIEIRTVDDDLPEEDEKFPVILLAPKGGATLDENHAKAVLTVLKSDNANGLFGFERISPITMSEVSNQSITITREKGKAGQVTVSWGVYKSYRDLQLASDDFEPYQGSIVFEDQEETKSIVIFPRDDNRPELDEHFVLKLVSSETGDSENTSTPTSGASLDPNLTSINITVIKNDFPFGLLQFMDRVPAWNDTIPPAVDAYYKNVWENSGSVRLVVVRAQGVNGEVKCFWKIEPQSAKPAVDYVNDAGEVIFPSGVRNNTIAIRLKDDGNVSELIKTFKVVLYNPIEGANLSSVASTAIVNILPSDDAFGVLNFTQDSIEKTVEESASVVLTIMRSASSLGPVTVYWKAIGPHQDDLMPMEGNVELPTGKETAQIQFRVADDASPELSESYLIQLVNVSSGRLAATGTVSNITIIANDHPYGIFQFNRSVVSVPESNKNVTVVFNRERGVLGAVRVHYETMSNGDMFGSIRQKALAGEDFVASNGYIDFSGGQKNASFVIQILDDDIPENEETLLVNLTRVEIVKQLPVIPVPTNSPVIGRSNIAQIRILKNDNASGVFQLSASNVDVTEPYSGAIVNVTRTAGHFGEVSVYFEVIPNSASTSDYNIPYKNIIFKDGQRIASVPIQIVDDSTPEYDETFTIRLLSSDGDALLGSPLECLVTIAANDYPHGIKVLWHYPTVLSLSLHGGPTFVEGRNCFV